MSSNNEFVLTHKQFPFPIKVKKISDFSGVTRYGEDCCSNLGPSTNIEQLLKLYGTRKDIDDHVINQEKTKMNEEVLNQHKFCFDKARPMAGMIEWWDLNLTKQNDAARRQFAVLQELMKPMELKFEDLVAWHHIMGVLHLDALVMKPNKYCKQPHLLVFARQFHEFIPYSTEATKRYVECHAIKKGKFDLFIGAYPLDDHDFDALAKSSRDSFKILDQVGLHVYTGLANLLTDSLAWRKQIDETSKQKRGIAKDETNIPGNCLG